MNKLLVKLIFVGLIFVGGALFNKTVERYFGYAVDIIFKDDSIDGGGYFNDSN